MKDYGIADRIENLSESQGTNLFQKFNDTYGIRKRIFAIRDKKAESIYEGSSIPIDRFKPYVDRPVRFKISEKKRANIKKNA